MVKKVCYKHVPRMSRGHIIRAGLSSMRLFDFMSIVTLLCLWMCSREVTVGERIVKTQQTLSLEDTDA